MKRKLMTMALIVTTVSTTALVPGIINANERNNNYNQVIETFEDSESVKGIIYEFTYENAPEEMRRDHEENCKSIGIEPLATDVLYSTSPEYAKLGEPRTFSIIREGDYMVFASANVNYRAKITTIRNGSRGNIVKIAQLLLERAMGYGLVADGIFGSKTETAVRNFQLKKGLSVDGIVGNNTWSKLDDYCDK